MTQPNPEVKNEQQYIYQTDQQVSVNAFIDISIDGEPVRFQVTSRYGATSDKISKTVTAAIEAYRAIREAYAKPEQPQRAVELIGVTEKKSFEPKPISASELPEGLPEGIECFKEAFDEIEITPQADDKVTVTFYRDGLKFPVGAKINKWKNENAVKTLSPLGEIDVTKAAKIRITGAQYYSNGAEYIIASGTKKGEKSHYKDIRLIEATF